MTEHLVLYEVTDRIATITLNRVDKRNALNPDLVEQLTNNLLKAEEDDDVKLTPMLSSVLTPPI